MRIRASTKDSERDVQEGGERMVRSLADAGEKGGKAFTQKIGEGLKHLGKTLSVAVTAPLLLAAKKGIDAAGDLQQSVANISTIKPTINTSEVFKALNEMQRRVPESSKDLADGLYNIFSSIEVPVADGIKLVEKFAKGALGAQTSSEAFGTAIIGVMNAYKKTTADADHISDLFFGTVNKGVVTGAQLAGALGPVTASAKAAGASMEEMFAAIAAGTKEGGDAAQNINNVSNLFQKISTKEAQKNIKDLGIVTTNTAGKFRPIFDVLGELKEKLSKMSQSEASQVLQKIFPDAQARIGAQVLISQLDMAKQVLHENTTAAGAAEDAYAKMSATWATQSKLFGNTVNSVLMQIGVAVLPRLTAALQEITPFVTKVSDAFSQMSGPMQNVVLGFGVAAAAVGPLLAVFGSLATGVSAAGAVLGVLTAPVLAVVAAVGLLGAAWATNFGGFRDAVQPIVDDIQATLTRLGAYLSNGEVTGPWKDFVESVSSIMMPLGETITQIWFVLREAFVAALPAIRDAGKFIVETFSDVRAWFTENLPDIQRTVQAVLGGIQAFWKEHGAQIIEIARGAWETIKGAVSAVVQLIAGVIKIAMKLIQGDWSGAWNALVATVQNVGAALVRASEGAGRLAVAALKVALNGLVALAGWAVKVTGQIGVAIVQGIVNGISSGVGRVAEAARNLASSAVNAAKRALNIKSPSRVFHQLGGYVAEGFSMGILDGVSRMAKAGAAMALAVQAGYSSIPFRPGETVEAFLARQSEAVKSFEKVKADLKRSIAESEDPRKATADALGIELSAYKQIGKELQNQLYVLKQRADIASGKLVSLPKGVLGPLPTREVYDAARKTPVDDEAEKEREASFKRATAQSKAASEFFAATLRSQREALAKGRDITNVQKLALDLAERKVKIGYIGYAVLRQQAEALDRIAAGEVRAASAAKERERTSRDRAAALVAENRFQESMLDVQKKLGGANVGRELQAKRLRELTESFTSFPESRGGGLGGAIADAAAKANALAVGAERASRYLKLEREVEGVNRLRDAFADAAKEMEGGFKTSLGNLVRGDFPSFFGSVGGMLDGFARRMADTFLQGQIDRGLGSLTSSFAGLFGGGRGGGLAGAIQSVPGLGGGGLLSAVPGFAGGMVSLPRRERGGPVLAGRPYLVGERRAEVFVPERNGTIHPDAGGAGGGVTIHMTVNATDANSFRQSSDQILLELRNGLARAGRNA